MSLSPQSVGSLPERFEILDLRHFSARQLRPLLMEEAWVWEQRLGWDYRSSIELLLQYLDSRILPGFVATLRGAVCGYIFCVYEGSKAVIGDVYVSREIDPGLGLVQILTRHLLEVLEASPGLERVESQLLLYDTGDLDEPFHKAGFTKFPRLYQECLLAAHQKDLPHEALPEGLELTPWIPALYQPTAELIHAAYAGHLDAQINDQYRSLHGTLRFLHNIVRFPGCGVFDSDASWVIRDTLTQVLAGVLLCSRIGPTMAHLTQLCVSPTRRGTGLGRRLLHHAMRTLPGQNYATITLTVSEQNQEAVRLYRKSGFMSRYRFDAMVLDRSRPAGY